MQLMPTGKYCKSKVAHNLLFDSFIDNSLERSPRERHAAEDARRATLSRRTGVYSEDAHWFPL